jgi:hypothetical protein
MDVETPNVSVTTNDERSPLITPRARVTKPAAWVWAIVMVTCLAGVIFLGVSGNDNDMGVSGNLNDAAAEHVAGDSSSFLGRRHRWRRKASRAVSRVVHHVVQFDWEGTANKFEKAMNDAKAGRHQQGAGDRQTQTRDHRTHGRHKRREEYAQAF